MNTDGKQSVLSGAQATGRIHLGNYLGAIKNWVALQDTYDCSFFIADLHSITVPQKPAELRKNTLDLVAAYIACGLDPKRTNLFVQSHIKGHTELSWILTCLTPLGQLQRMTQFKDKSSKGDTVYAGLLCYPPLMAADILLHNAHKVPVGEDQKQHLEITRDLALKFNGTYSETFNVPEPLIFGAGGRVMSLQNPTKKMSKSDSDSNATVFLFEPIDLIRKKIMSAVTDSEGTVRYDTAGKPGISNLIEIYSTLTGQAIPSVEENFGSKGYAVFKQAVAEAVIETLKPLQTTYAALVNNKDQLTEILKLGAATAQHRADRMLQKVYRKTGFLQL